MLRTKLVPLTQNKAQAHMQKLMTHLQQTGETFAIWGAGATGQRAMEYLQRNWGETLRPQYIVDNNSTLWNAGGVISPDTFFRLKDQPKNLLICVYVADQVARQVKEAGYTGNVMIFSTLQLFDTSERWQFYEEHMSELEDVYDMVADDKSRVTVAGFLNSIRSGDVSYLEKINEDSSVKTLDPVILQYTDQEIFADIGAFTGDTISKFLEITNGNYKRIIGFELDRQNYEVLRQTTDGMENIYIKNVAVGAAPGKVRFLSGRSESSALSEQGDSEAEMIALDDVEEMQGVTFIKISVSGLELTVLEGAKKLLRRNAPKVAAYVSGKQLWEIPKYLKEMVPEYRLYIRHYGQGTQGMVCYAIRNQ